MIPTPLVRLTRRGIRYSSASVGRTVDVTLDGHRVWSTTLAPGRRTQAWPPALRERLLGRAVGIVSDSISHNPLWTGTLHWSGSGSPDLVDGRGRTLRVDKWGRMKPSFETGEDIRPQVAAAAADVLSFLRQNGFDAFIVGGTLLGAVRDGEILPHDDDADLAYLSKHSHPSDLVLENDRLHRLLVENGFRVIRHSWSHLQVLSDDDAHDYYVDIFTAFYKSGMFHEPIHVRAAGMEDAILPLGEIELHGVQLAAPRHPEAWLAACYGPSWRTPDPSFVFETPWQTQRRFHAWFGSFYMGINNWTIRYGQGGSAHESDLIRDHVISHADAVVDLGAGNGEDLRAYREAGLTAVGAESVGTARSVLEGEANVNLVDYLPAIDFMRKALDDLPTDKQTVVTANHVLACQDPRGRGALLHLFDFALRRGARVITADYEELGRYRPDMPRTWHLDWPTRAQEAARAGLRCILLERTRFRDEDGIGRMMSVVEYQQEENHP
ncbi:LicD family protein [Microbacterium sp. NPDC058345]|uniref:LicD family protein n=1 Tax=Microbacterium sp. NPDC058345 TaxID=3346455 RepID=UPI00366306D0